MKLKSVSIILILFLLLPFPVLAADSLGIGEEMIAGGINNWIKSQADSLISPMGVKTGNLTDNTSTPAQKLIYNIDTYELDPYSVEWIRQTVIDDYKLYVLVGALILIGLAIFNYIQMIDAPLVGEITEFVYGREKYFNFREFLKTFAKLIFIPIVLPFVFIFSINFEQALSSGIMKDALQYISFDSGNLTLYCIEAVAYALDSLFVFARILLINEVCAKVMFVGIMLCVPWLPLKNIGLGIIMYFYTALLMRPVLLWITTMAVQYVAGMSELDRTTLGPEVYAISLVFGLIVCILGVLGPIIYVLWNTFVGVYLRRRARGYYNV